jgi:hypothetical protein
MIGVGLYSCSTEDRPSATLNARLPCRALAFSFLGLGTGVRSSERRRPCAGREVRLLPAQVQSVVAGGLLIRRVQDRTIEERLGQAWPPSAASFVRVKPTG